MPDATSRQRLIEDHLPLARSVAQRFASGGEGLEDLAQVGAIGLIKAADRFDPGRGTPFAPYAAATIAGEIRHHLRDRSAPVRLPRRLRADGLRVHAVALDAAHEPAVDHGADRDDRVALWTAMRALDARERHIIALRFFGDLSQAQIGARLGLSQVHVCRLLERALAKLHAELAAAPRHA